MEFYDIYPSTSSYDDNSSNNNIKPLKTTGNSSTNESLSQESFDDITINDQYLSKKNKKGYNTTTNSIITRLKTEIAILREAVDVANGSDIEMMQTKIRVANADINKLRERNAEYKTRIQLLEQRLFDALQSNNSSSSSSNSSGGGSNNDDDEFQDADYYDKSSSDNIKGINNASTIITNNYIIIIIIITIGIAFRSSNWKINNEKLEKKCNFLQKLLSSLELRLLESQKVIENQKNLLNKKEKVTSSSLSLILSFLLLLRLLMIVIRRKRLTLT